MKILLLGKSGQVGWELQRSLSPLGEVVALAADSAELCGNFTDLDGLAQTVRKVAPHVIVNAAAYTAVDKAEGEIELARAVNALAPGLLAQEAAKLRALLVHYSTDYVFDGGGTKPRVESDATNPLSVYGATKLEGEQAIQASGCRHLIFRTSWVYATRGANFAKTILRLARERNQLTVIDDQVGAPTGAELLADCTAHAIRNTFQYPERTGLFHLTASGETSWYGYAKFVLEIAKDLGVELKAGPDAIQPISTSNYPTPARRPLNSRLNTDHFRKTFGLTLPSWQIGVSRMLHELQGVNQ